MSAQRTVIVGLDGMPYGLIRDLAHRGVMPNVQALASTGVFRQMASSIPEISSVSWSSIISGANPARHGIFGFTDLAEGTYRRIYPNFSSFRETPFWDRPSYGRSIILNVPSTYPARAINGVLIAGFVALNLQKAVYPATLIPTLQQMEYRVDVDAGKAGQSTRLFLADLEKTLRARISLYRYLWHEEDWDTFMLVFTGTDRLAHYLWNAYEDESHPYNEAFLDHLCQIDRVIGEIADDLGPTDRLVMVSDHGFERLEKEVYVNFVLQEHGFFALEQGAPGRLTSIAFGSNAFALDPGRIYVNMQGKYPQGCVSPADREPLLRDITALFDSIEIEGQKLIQRVFRKEEIYEGPLIDRAPDLILLANAGLNLRATVNADHLWDRGSRTGKHSQQDAFLLVAGDFDPTIVPQQPTVTDVVKIMDHFLE